MLRKPSSRFTHCATLTLLLSFSSLSGCNQASTDRERVDSTQAAQAVVTASTEDCAKLIVQRGLNDTSNKQLLQRLGIPEGTANLKLSEIRIALLGAEGGSKEQKVAICQSLVAGKPAEANKLALKVAYDAHQVELKKQTEENVGLARNIGSSFDNLERTVQQGQRLIDDTNAEYGFNVQ